MIYRVKEAAQLAGVSPRTLHHYDAIGLLPAKKEANGYRYYQEEDLERLQLILYYKYLGLSLEDIGKLLEANSTNFLQLLEQQLTQLQSERQRLDTLIETLTASIQAKKAGQSLSPQAQFRGFSYPDMLPYVSQARQNYGLDVMIEAEKRQEGQKIEVAEKFNAVFRQWAQHFEAGLSIESEPVQSLCQELYHLLNTYAFDCSLTVFGYIGQNYQDNPDFRHNLNRFAPDLAVFVSQAIQYFVRHTKS